MNAERWTMLLILVPMALGFISLLVENVDLLLEW